MDPNFPHFNSTPFSDDDVYIPQSLVNDPIYQLRMQEREAARASQLASQESPSTENMSISQGNVPRRRSQCGGREASRRPSTSNRQSASASTKQSDTVASTDGVPEVNEPQSRSRPSRDTTSDLMARRRSEVWKHFTIEDIGDGRIKALCSSCRKYYSCASSSGTGHLGRHMKTCLARAAKTGKQTELQFNTASGTLSGFKFNKEVHARELAKYIVWSESPFSLGEDIKFQTYVQNSLCPAFTSVSRKTIRRYALTQHKQYRTNLIELLSNINSAISLTSDSWKSNHQGLHYICVTAHFVDDSWELQKRIISFQVFEFPHTARAISEHIQKTIFEYGISNKIFSISFDNATNNTSAVGLLKRATNPIFDGAFFHIRCACHILNLIVQDGMRVIEDKITTIRNACLYIKSSRAREQEFIRYLRQAGNESYKKISIDVPTRWNSTYIMLRSALEHKDTLTIFYDEKNHTLISEEDWTCATFLVQLLHQFYATTLSFSASYSPTTNLVVEHLCVLSAIFVQWRENEFVGHIVNNMTTKLCNYWSEIPMLYCLSSIFDPRKKLRYTLDYLKIYYDNMGLPNCEEHCAAVNNMLNAIFDLYSQRIDRGNHTPVDIPTSSGSNLFTDGFAILTKLSRARGHSSSASSSSGRAELLLYLESDLFGVIRTSQQYYNFDVLKWWKQYSTTYPVLASIARDLLTPPVSTVPSESAFSAGGRVIDVRRSRLNAESVEMCICLKDWYDAELRIQDTDPTRKRKRAFTDQPYNEEIDGDDDDENNDEEEQQDRRAQHQTIALDDDTGNDDFLNFDE